MVPSLTHLSSTSGYTNLSGKQLMVRMTSNKKKLFPASLLKLRRPFKESKQNNKESNEHKKIKVISRHEMIFSQRRIHAYTRISLTFPSSISTRNKLWNESSSLFSFQNAYDHFCQPFLSTFCVNFLVWTVYYEYSSSSFYLCDLPTTNILVPCKLRHSS